MAFLCFFPLSTVFGATCECNPWTSNLQRMFVRVLGVLVEPMKYHEVAGVVSTNFHKLVLSNCSKGFMRSATPMVWSAKLPLFAGQHDPKAGTEMKLYIDWCDLRPVPICGNLVLYSVAIICPFCIVYLETSCRILLYSVAIFDSTLKVLHMCPCRCHFKFENQVPNKTANKVWGAMCFFFRTQTIPISFPYL